MLGIMLLVGAIFIAIMIYTSQVSGQVRAADVDKKEADKKELARLEGTWIIVKMEVNGRSLLEKDKPEPKLVIKGGKVTSDAKKAPKGGLALAKILDPSKKPKAITVPLEGDIKFYGIYEVKGDQLRVCGDAVEITTEKNPEGRRPKKFDSNEGLLIVFKRKK
jgi:uncharacterized protein (TIGR03067 family)